LIEGNGTKSGIVDIRRKRCGYGEWTKGTGHETSFASFVADAIGRFSCHASSNAIYLAGCIAQANVMNNAFEKFWIFAAIVWFTGKEKFVQADRGRTESIGFNHIGAGAEIFFVDALDRLWFRQQQKLDCAFEVLAFPIAKTFAAIIRFSQAEALQSRAHRAVEDDDALTQKRGKRMGCV
jgi:hypothetical protein